MFVGNINVIDVKRSDYIEKIKRELTTIFEIVDIGSISFSLGLKIEKD